MTDYDKLLKDVTKNVTDYLYEQNVRSDCGIESLAEDLMNIVLNKSAYDKMCFLLEDIDCHFTTDETMINGNILTIEISPVDISSYGGVGIEFYDDGSFKGFIASE